VEEIERREKVIEQVRLQHAQSEAQRYRKREIDLAWREHISRSRIMDLEKDARARLDKDRKQVRQSISWATQTDSFDLPRQCSGNL
jgi:hypothetical protein